MKLKLGIAGIGLGGILLFGQCSNNDLAGVIVTENSIKGSARHIDSSHSQNTVYLYASNSLQSPLDSATPDAAGQFAFKHIPSGNYLIASDSSGSIGNVSPVFAYDSTKGTVQNLVLKPLLHIAWTSKINNPLIYAAIKPTVSGNQIVFNLSPDTTRQNFVFAKTTQSLSLQINEQGINISGADTLLGNGGSSATQTFIDSRDNSTYHTVEIGRQTWITENIHYTNGSVKPSEISCPTADSTLCASWGRLYTWLGLLAASDGATTPNRAICPVGFVLATKADYEQLLATLGGGQRAAKFLKSKTGWATPGWDLFGMNFKPNPKSASAELILWTPNSIAPMREDTAVVLSTTDQITKVIGFPTTSMAAAKCLRNN